jgi:hypothetical protein
MQNSAGFAQSTHGQPISKGDTVQTVRLMYDVPANATGVVLKIIGSHARILYGRNLTGQRIIGVQPLNNLNKITPV